MLLLTAETARYQLCDQTGWQHLRLPHRPHMAAPQTSHSLTSNLFLSELRAAMLVREVGAVLSYSVPAGLAKVLTRVLILGTETLVLETGQHQVIHRIQPGHALVPTLRRDVGEVNMGTVLG